jgi:hypothetical protein
LLLLVGNEDPIGRNGIKGFMGAILPAKRPEKIKHLNSMTWKTNVSGSVMDCWLLEHRLFQRIFAIQ